MSTIITTIDRHSPAEKAGIQVGEQLLTINGHPIVDVLDYRFYGYDPLSRVELKTAAGDVRTVTIRKAEGQDLGLNFDTYLMDEMRCCANHCIFCFVDQMPPGMRSTLYFKDDDARLSFLLGNYITLTNLTEREAQRIIDLHISPINVSVHTTDPQLHCTMLGNKNAERSLDYIQAFCKAGIVMNGQIVICPGWNDGDQLRRTLRDLTEWQFSSCSLVPVGITKYRQGLAKLRPVSPEDARDIIAIAEEFGQENLRRFGTRRFFCADELCLFFRIIDLLTTVVKRIKNTWKIKDCQITHERNLRCSILYDKWDIPIFTTLKKLTVSSERTVWINFDLHLSMA